MMAAEEPGVRRNLISIAGAPVESVTGVVRTSAKLTLFDVATCLGYFNDIFIGERVHPKPRLIDPSGSPDPAITDDRHCGDHGGNRHQQDHKPGNRWS